MDYTYKDLKSEYKMFEDSGDKWGSALGAHFDLCAELDHRAERDGVEAMRSWQYRAPATLDDHREKDSYYYDLYIGTSSADLVKFGDLLSRYTEKLAAAGHSY